MGKSLGSCFLTQGVFGAGSMHLSGVRPSVRLSVPAWTTAANCRRYRSIAAQCTAARSSAGKCRLSAYVLAETCFVLLHHCLIS